MAKKQIEKLLNKAYFYLYLRQRTEKEMVDYLKRKAEIYHASDNDVQQVMQELRMQNYLDDDAFITSYVRYRTSVKPKGEYALRKELLQKGISESKIDSYFEKNTRQEDVLAKDALKKVWSRYKNLEPLKRKKRAIDFLSRRGFSFDTAKQAFEELEKITD